MTEPVDFGYDSYLGQVPEALRGQIEPAFKAYSDKLQQDVTGQLGQYAPYKELQDQGWTPEHVTVGLNLLQTLENDPAKVYQALLQEHPELGQQIPAPVTPTPNTPPVDQNIDPALDTRLSQMDQMLQLLYQGFTQQQQQTIEQQQAQQEQTELAQFRTQLDQVAPEDKYPRQFILSYVAQGQTPEQAVKSFTEWQTSQFQQQRSNGAPVIAPAGGGGLPSEPLDTSKLTNTQRENLIAQYLETANQQR